MNAVSNNKSVAALDDFELVVRCATMCVKSGKLPKDINIETATMMILYGRELGFGPIKSLNEAFNVIQGKITLKPMMMNEMILKAGHYISIDKWDIDECILTGVRANNKSKMTLRFSLKDAERAGLVGKDNYKKNPKQMLFARAMGNLGRMLFADVIGNVYAEGEFEENIPMKAITYDENDTMLIEAQPVQEEIKPLIKEIPIEALHQAVEIMGLKCDIEDLKKYVFTLAENHEKPQSYIVSQAMQNDERLGRFIETYEIFVKSRIKAPEQ